MRAHVIVAAVFLALRPLPVESGEAEDLSALRKEYADVLALDGPAKKEILAIARVLREKGALAIDFTHLETPQHCLNSGGDMLHVADDPQAKIPLAYMHPAEPLVAAGLDVKKLPVEPEADAALEPGKWYYYPAGGRTEPFHGKALPAPMLIRTVGAP